jgi:hypothetical protein
MEDTTTSSQTRTIATGTTIKNEPSEQCTESTSLGNLDDTGDDLDASYFNTTVEMPEEADELADKGSRSRPVRLVSSCYDSLKEEASFEPEAS